MSGQQQADADQRPERQKRAAEKGVPQGGKSSGQRFAHHAHRGFRQSASGDLCFQGKDDAHIERDHEDMGIAVPAVAGEGARPVRAFWIEITEGRGQHEGESDLLHASGGDGRVDAAGARKAVESDATGKHGSPLLLLERFNMKRSRAN